MKICELKINDGAHRAKMVEILAFAGYRVSIEERGNADYWRAKDYFVIVEDKTAEPPATNELVEDADD